MARPNWEYIRVDVLLPENCKLDVISASAKWTLVEMWCYCGQHLTDGFIRQARWNRFGTKRIRESIIAAGLAAPVPGGYQMHDYLEHQRSRAEVLELKEKRRKAGAKGGHAKASATASAKQVPEQTPQQTPQQKVWQISGKPLAEAEAEAEAEERVPAVEPAWGSHSLLSNGQDRSTSTGPHARGEGAST